MSCCNLNPSPLGRGLGRGIIAEGFPSPYPSPKGRGNWGLARFKFAA
ncbi:hypothetical protein [Alysiella filiformis]|nr:hypothetical protein [Alysiella filiformis]